MTRRATAVLVLALGLLFAAAPATYAVPVMAPAASSTLAVGVPGIGPDCKGEPPLPASPSGQLGLRPAVTSTADPFTTAGVSMASVYGTNYQWWAYDNGCGAGSDIMPRLTTNIANVIGLQLPGLLLAIGQGLFTAVIDPSSWIGFLDKPIEHATASVAAGVWFPFLSLALLLVAVVTLLRAARGRLAGTITATVWALTVLVLVTWVVGYPAESLKMLDSGIQTAVVATAQGFSPDAQQVGSPASSRTGPDTDASARVQAVAAMDATWDTINRSTVYRSWLAGVFGDPDSPTATRFGPSVFTATHFSWTEYDTYQRDPTGAGKQVVDRKAGDFRRVAQQLASADPVAYQFFTGNRTGDRFGTAVLSLLITLVTTAFFIIAGLLTVLGYAVARLIVPATPAAGVLFLLDSFRDLALSWGQRIVQVLVMGPIAFLAALVLFAFTSAIFTATMPDGLKYLLISGLSWLAWRLLRPHTALGRMHVPGKKLLGQVLAMKLAVRGRTTRRGHDGDEEHEDEESSSASAAGQERDQLVYTPTPARNDKPATVGGEHEQVVYYSAAPAGAPPHPLPEARLGSPIRPTPAAPAPAVVADARRSRWHSGDLGVFEPAADSAPVERAPSAGPPPRTVPIEVVTQERQMWRSPRPLAPDPPRGALPAVAGPLEGNLLDADTPLPTRVHEANMTRDADGKAVFQVYRPEGSRFYAQDE